MLAKPTKVQYEWQEAERSMFLHFGPATWQGREYDDGSVPVEQINPTLLDTDQWCSAATAFGAKRVVFVAKHTGGFCWWQTDTTEYSVKNSPWRDGKGDVLAELSASCKKYDLALGVYIYPGDRTWGAYIGGGGKTRDPNLQQAYNKVFRQQLTEVLTGYGTIKEVWFDGSCVIEVGDILEKHAKEAVIFQGPHATIRWCGTERGVVPDPAWNTLWKSDLITGSATVVQSDPDGDCWAPLEVDTTLYDHYWFWSPENATKRKSLEQLISAYYQSVGRGSVLLLNTSPNCDGLIPKEDIEALEEFGNEIDRRFGQPLAECAGSRTCLELYLDGEKLINHLVLMEDYSQGERVRGYRVEALTDGIWRIVAKGKQIGRKRILAIEPIAAERVRLVIEQSVGEPLIRSFAVYNIDCADFDSILAAQSKVSLVYDAKTDSWVAQGEGKVIFTWNADEIDGKSLPISLDLSKYVTEPGQYQLLFSIEGVAKLEVAELEVLLEGEPTEGVLSCMVPGHRYNITRTSAVENSEGGKTAIRGVIRCTGAGERGNITIKKHL